jgi:hypothetical protein
MRASSLPLLLKCYGSEILPQTPEKDRETDESRRGKEWGKLAHRWKETGRVEGASSQARAAFKLALQQSGVNRGVLWPEHPSGKHEVSYALRVDGERTLLARPASEGDYTGHGEEWVTGTADYIGALDGTLWVDDLKTGKVYLDQYGNNRYPQDVSSYQLRFYALCAALAVGHTGEVAVTLTHWPRLPLYLRHSPPTRGMEVYPWEDLEAFYTSLEKMYVLYSADRAIGVPRVNPGAHCRFCPSKSFCLFSESE